MIWNALYIKCNLQELAIYVENSQPCRNRQSSSFFHFAKKCSRTKFPQYLRGVKKEGGQQTVCSACVFRYRPIIQPGCSTVCLDIDQLTPWMQYCVFRYRPIIPRMQYSVFRYRTFIPPGCSTVCLDIDQLFPLDAVQCVQISTIYPPGCSTVCLDIDQLSPWMQYSVFRYRPIIQPGCSTVCLDIDQLSPWMQYSVLDIDQLSPLDTVQCVQISTNYPPWMQYSVFRYRPIIPPGCSTVSLYIDQ